MKCNISRFRFLFFSLLFSFSFILIAPTDNTYATRVDVDVNNLTSVFNPSNYVGITLYSDHITINNPGSFNGHAVRAVLKDPSIVNCSSVYSRIVYADGFSDFVPSNSDFANIYLYYVSGSYNNGIVYRFAGNNVAVFYSTSSSYDLSNGNYKFDSITLGCSEEEVAPQTPTPTPTEEPTPTPTAEPTPTPTVTPGETVNPNDYEYNQMEDTAVRYSFYAFCIICLSAFLIYEIIIKRIILK